MSKALELLEQIKSVDENKYHKTRTIIFNSDDMEFLQEAIAELEVQENESLEMSFQMDKGSTAMYPPKVIFFDGYIYELKGNK